MAAPIHERTIEALLVALAMQVSASPDAAVSAGVIEHLADQNRGMIRALFGCIGHLVHYGTGAELDGVEESLAAVSEQLLAALRRRGAGPLRSGDFVELAVDLPQAHAKAGRIMRVYVVGEDGTIDVGSESISDDYVISTVNLADVRRVERRL